MSRRSAALLASLVSLAVPAAASAGPLVASAPAGCADQPASQVFLPWLDVAQYVLAPGGTAESTAGWSQLSSASIANGSEVFAVHSEDDERSMRLAPGAVATTGTMCVGIEHPTLRFFTRASSPSGQVAVDVLFETATGEVVSAPVGIAAGGAWAPTPVMPVAASLLPLLPGEHTPVRFRFTSVGSASITIDDIYVDPMGRN